MAFRFGAVGMAIAVAASGLLALQAQATVPAIVLDLGGYGQTEAWGIQADGTQTVIVGYGVDLASGVGMPAVWTGPDLALHVLPVGERISGAATGIAGGQVSGMVVADDYSTAAVTWNAATGALTPLGTSGSIASATNGALHVGQAGNLAILWQDGVATDITAPASSAGAVTAAAILAISPDGATLAGRVQHETENFPHAYAWIGTLWNAVDLNPAGAASSEARGADGSWVVGVAAPDQDYNHAYLWDTAAETAFDLGAGSGFYNTQANAIRGGLIAGAGMGVDDHMHALLWQGANPVPLMDLQDSLPPGLTDSVALAVADNGWVVGYAQDESMTRYAVLWQVPEPGTLGLLALGTLGLCRRRR